MPRNKPPPTFQSTVSCANTTISSINESPQSKIPSDIRLPLGESESPGNVNADACADDDADSDDSSKSNCNEVSLDEHRISVFDYPEWVVLIDLNDAGGDDNCDNSTKASIKKAPKPGWKCNFCNQVFIGRNATKAICHLAGVKKMNIKICRGNIPEKHLKVIHARNNIRVLKNVSQSKTNHNQHCSIAQDRSHLFHCVCHRRNGRKHKVSMFELMGGVRRSPRLARSTLH